MTAIAFLVLVPLIPAVILYRLFEQKTIVTGPFKGLRLDLSGAFAGYFLILIVCSGLLFEFGGYQGKIDRLTSELKETSELGRPWTVRVPVKLRTRDGRDDEGTDPVIISIQPIPRDLGDGRYEVRVLKEKPGDRSRFPALQLSKSGYFTRPVYLEPSDKLGKEYDKNIDEVNRIIDISEPIELRERPAKNQDAPPKQP
jgi:hypothetical protein